MANNYVIVTPSLTGTKMQTFENTVGGNTVDSEGVTLVRSSDNTEVGSSTQPLRIDPTGVTVQPVSGTFWQTTQPVSIAATVNVAVAPASSGGVSNLHLVSAGSTNANNVKASAGQVYGWNIFNNAAYPIYVKFYNTAGTPTPGTGVVHTIGVQAGTHVFGEVPSGMAFSTGIGLSITKGIADADATAVLASDCVVDIKYA